MSAELSSLGIAQIVESVIADYDLRDEDGNELTDDLYVIRSEQLDELGLTVARRIHKATRELEAQGKGFKDVHSMTFGSVPTCYNVYHNKWLTKEQIKRSFAYGFAGRSSEQAG